MIIIPAILISPSTALPLYSFWPMTTHGTLRPSLYAAFCVILGLVQKNGQNRFLIGIIGVTLFGITKAIFPGHLLKHFFFSPPDHSWGFLQDLPAAGAVFIVVIDDSACLEMGIDRDRPYILKAALF